MGASVGLDGRRGRKGLRVPGPGPFYGRPGDEKMEPGSGVVWSGERKLGGFGPEGLVGALLMIEGVGGWVCVPLSIGRDLPRQIWCLLKAAGAVFVSSNALPGGR